MPAQDSTKVTGLLSFTGKNENGNNCRLDLFQIAELAAVPPRVMHQGKDTAANPDNNKAISQRRLARQMAMAALCSRPAIIADVGGLDCEYMGEERATALTDFANCNLKYANRTDDN